LKFAFNLRPNGRHNPRAAGMVTIGLLLGVAVPAGAQKRVDVTPLVGYRSSASITATDAGGEHGGKVQISAGSCLGIAMGVRYQETAVIEFRFTRQNTVTLVSGIAGTPVGRGTDTRLEQYHGDFTREFPLENAPRIRPFLTGNIGMTRLVWGGRSASRFSFGLGGGLKYFPARWVGFRVQAQWLPIWLNPQVKAFACGGGCVAVFGGRLADQGEVSFGPTFSF
jgi:hypothetical protein